MLLNKLLIGINLTAGDPHGAGKDGQGILERGILPTCRSTMDPNPGIYHIEELQACCQGSATGHISSN